MIKEIQMDNTLKLQSLYDEKTKLDILVRSYASEKINSADYDAVEAYIEKTPLKKFLDKKLLKQYTDLLSAITKELKKRPSEKNSQ